MNRVESVFWTLTKHELNHHAIFDDELSQFKLHSTPFNNISNGTYQLISTKHKNIQAQSYRINSLLGESVINQAKARMLELNELVFDLSSHKANIEALKPYIGKSGYATLTKLNIHSFEDEEYLISTAITDDNQTLDSEVSLKLFEINATISKTSLDDKAHNQLIEYKKKQIGQATQNSEEKNGEFFNAEIEKLDKWADDQLLSAEKELKELRKEINSKRTLSRTAPTQQKLKIQMDIRNLEKKQQKLKREMEGAEDIIFAKRSEIIDTLADSLNQGVEDKELFTIRWRVA